MTDFDALVAEIRKKRDHYEAIIRAALRETAEDDPALLTDDWGDTSTVEEFVEAHLYDLEGVPLDADPGIKWCYGQMYAADELLRFAETLLLPAAQAPSPDSPPPSPTPSPAIAAVVQAALDSGGACCPTCGSDDTAELDVDEVEGTWYQRKVCGTCGNQWTNVWEFARLLIFASDGDPDVYERPA